MLGSRGSRCSCDGFVSYNPSSGVGSTPWSHVWVLVGPAILVVVPSIPTLGFQSHALPSGNEGHLMWYPTKAMCLAPPPITKTRSFVCDSLRSANSYRNARVVVGGVFKGRTPSTCFRSPVRDPSRSVVLSYPSTTTVDHRIGERCVRRDRRDNGYRARKPRLDSITTEGVVRKERDGLCWSSVDDIVVQVQGNRRRESAPRVPLFGTQAVGQIT